MAKLKKGHWTERSVDDFLYRIASDFVRQIEKAMGGEINQAKLAETLGVTEGRVSQIMNNPGNLTLRKIIEYSRALGRKVSVVAYEDDDPQNLNGPINSEVFTLCWEKAGKPVDFFAFEEGYQEVAVNAESAIKTGDRYSIPEGGWNPPSAFSIFGLKPLQSKAGTSSETTLQ
jgi:transcriptional regulator with XRE-family HTH domain